MSTSDWRPLRGVDHGQLSEARLQAHCAAQWLARAARAFIPPQPDDGHTNLGWDHAFGGFTTHRLKDNVRLGLKISDLTLAMLIEGKARSEFFPLNKRSDTDARGWLGEQLGARGLNPGKLDTPSPYQIPAHAIASGAPYDTSGLVDALAELAGWFANAHRSLGSIWQQMIERELAASPVRCWPHHFDLATLISLDESNAEKARTVGAGLSPGDEHYAEPYFYVSPYPSPDVAALQPLPKLGHWHTRDFTAAIAPASRIMETKDRRAETDAFLYAAIEGAIKALS